MGLSFGTLDAASFGSGASILRESILLPDGNGRAIAGAPIVRRILTPDELASTMSFSVTLRMRDISGLKARVTAGERISMCEMEARYLPLLADYKRAALWLSQQGFTPAIQDRMHTSIFMTGTVTNVARAFGVQFARVAASDGEYTSAISDPSVPPELSDLILSVNHLQPQLRLRHVKAREEPSPDGFVSVGVSLTPNNLSYAYKMPRNVTGAGQIIAIVDEQPVLNSDLEEFWRVTGIPQSISRFVTIDVDQTLLAPSLAPNVIDESNLDVQWASAMAPGAGIRLYLSHDPFECLVRIQNDLPDFPGLSVISISYGAPEDTTGGRAAIEAYSQLTTSIAAAGVSILASSGDGGSNPGNSGGFVGSAPAAVSYPACDPNVTGVGGTTLDFAGNFEFQQEVTWDDLTNGTSASGGGVSTQYSIPEWQTGGPLLASQTMRCVPDVAAMSTSLLTDVNLNSTVLQNPFTGEVAALVFVDGSAKSIGGTSLACPIWAGITALINEGRANSNIGPIGLLNPHLYPLAGTPAFNDITSGSNGAYQAGPGYDLCTGLGSPNVSYLVAALSAPQSNRRLVNVSARAHVGTGSDLLIGGFEIKGPPGSSKEILVRGVGPALGALGVTGSLAQPIAGVYDSASRLIASNSGWGNALAGGNSGVSATFRNATSADMASVGAFSLAPDSADSALVLSLPPGDYSLQVSGFGGTSGVALAEIYEMDLSAPEYITNVSARCFVGFGEDVVVSGFVISGSQSVALLIRGIGPALAGFGLSSTLAQPTISLNDADNNLIASNTGWGTPPSAGTSLVAAAYRQATPEDMTAAGAFSLASGSSDSAMVVTLPPGSYTVTMSGAGGATGTGLAEVYELSGP